MAVAYCGFRPRSQRRARPVFTVFPIKQMNAPEQLVCNNLHSKVKCNFFYKLFQIDEEDEFVDKYPNKGDTLRIIDF